MTRAPYRYAVGVRAEPTFSEQVCYEQPGNKLSPPDLSLRISQHWHPPLTHRRCPLLRESQDLPLRRWRRRGCAAGRVRTRREDALHEPHPVGGHADRLLTAMPGRVVHDGTPHVGHRRDGGQFHQPFPFKRALDAFGDAFVEPQGVDEPLIGQSASQHPLH